MTFIYPAIWFLLLTFAISPINLINQALIIFSVDGIFSSVTTANRGTRIIRLSRVNSYFETYLTRRATFVDNYVNDCEANHKITSEI